MSTETQEDVIKIIANKINTDITSCIILQKKHNAGDETIIMTEKNETQINSEQQGA